MGSDCPEEIECGRYFKRTKYPLFKIPCKKPAQIEGTTPLAEVSETMLFDLENDYGQVNNLAGKGDPAEQHMIDLLLRGLEIPCKKPAQIEGTTPLAEVSETMLFDLENDYGQVNNLAGKGDPAEQHMIDLLLRGLEEHESPAEQKERLGLG